MSSTSNKDALMASLMGTGAESNNNGTNSADHALFGNDDSEPTVDEASEQPLFLSPDADTGALILNGDTEPEAKADIVPEPFFSPTVAESPAVVPSSPLPDALVTPTAAASLLAQSGLLTGTSNGGGGLFDDIEREEEEEKKRQEEEELKRKQQEEALKRKQEEEAQRRAEEAAAAAAAHQKQIQEAEEFRKQQEFLQQQQQLQSQMESVHLTPQSNNPQSQHHPANQPNINTTPNQYLQQQISPTAGFAPTVQAGFYRDHSPMLQQPNQQQPMMQSPQAQQYPSNYYTGNASAQQPQTFAYGTPQQQPMPGPTPSRYYTPAQQQPGSLQPQLTPSPNAGMHNIQSGLGFASPSLLPTEPTPLSNCIYQEITITHPLLIQGTASLFGFKQAPHWSYQLNTRLSEGTLWLVRRRFRHVVALEDRLRQECPGAILPPRPEKHATRAIEEASTTQSTEFAVQRAAELQVYLNQLARHPIVHSSQALRLFLALQDDLGTAWPEVSNNTLTRLTNVGVGAAVSLSENASFWKESNMDGDYSEESAEILALQSSESIRIGAVLQAVPKLQGAATLYKEHSEQMGAVGVELGRLCKEMIHEDRELAEPFEIMANGMLRSGRRSKRCALELAAALNTFTTQYKLCMYEKLAFQDRKNAIIRRSKERTKADQRAAQLMFQQRSMYPPQPYGQQQPYGYPPQQPYRQPQQQQAPYGFQQPYHPGGLDHLTRDAVVMDELAVDAEKECEEVGTRLKDEVNRVAWQRRTEWKSAVKIIASAMKEATSERLAIWESVRVSYLTAFPEYKEG